MIVMIKIHVHEIAELIAELKVAGKVITFVVDTAALDTVMSEYSIVDH